MADTSFSAKHRSDYKRQRDSLQRYIDQLPWNSDFELQNWLFTLDSEQLKHIELDAMGYCCRKDFPYSYEISIADLIDIASIAYRAEGCLDGEVEKSGEFVDSILIGLAVAACIERLRRTGWVVITGRMMIALRDPRPYRVTQRGMEDGVWSDDPFTLWILGSKIELH